MARRILMGLGILAFLLIVGAGPAGNLVRQLMDMPTAEADPQGTMNPARWELIRQIGALGDAAIPDIQAGRRAASTELQRSELAQALGEIATPPSTAALLPLVSDKEDSVRQSAISALSGRVNATLQKGGSPDIASTLARQLPLETNELNRSLICGAMGHVEQSAKTLAIAAMKDRLANDPSRAIRCQAACALTGFGDNSGLDEIRKAILALQDDPHSGFELEMLAPAVERSTGKTFGPVPLNPMLLSNTAKLDEIQARRAQLLAALAAWAKQPTTISG